MKKILSILVFVLVGVGSMYGQAESTTVYAQAVYNPDPENSNQYIPGGIATYIKTKRLTKAKELLQSTDMSVSEISQKVGFSDYNYFLKSFKKHYGVSTKIMRKKNN